jgi:hypothetical protein
MSKGGAGKVGASRSVKRRGLSRINLERLPSVSIAKNPNNRQERAQVNDNRYDNEKHARRSVLIAAGGYFCEGPVERGGATYICRSGLHSGGAVRVDVS